MVDWVLFQRGQQRFAQVNVCRVNSDLFSEFQ